MKTITTIEITDEMVEQIRVDVYGKDDCNDCHCEGSEWERVEIRSYLTAALPIIEQAVRGETLIEVVQAHRDLHKTYGSTSVCRGGFGGQTLMPHCAEVCDNPRAHDKELTKWQALELEAINYSHAARIVREGK